MKHRNDFQRETWMVKKGIESNMVGKKKKETGKTSINTHKKDKIKKKKWSIEMIFKERREWWRKGLKATW